METRNTTVGTNTLRKERGRYPRTSAQQVNAVKVAYNSFLHAFTPGGSGKTPDLTTLLEVFPLGKLQAVRYIPERDAVGFTMPGRNERYLDPEVFLMAALCSLFDPTTLMMKNNSNAKDGFYYLDIGGTYGPALWRVIVDTLPGQTVTNIGDHHDLTAGNLQVSEGSSFTDTPTQTGRELLMIKAVEAYSKNAVAWALDGLIPLIQYRHMLHNCFRLIDIRRAHYFMRPVSIKG